MRLKLSLLFVLSVIATSCLVDESEQKSSLTFFRVEKDALESYVNEKPLPKQPNLSIDKMIVNNEYPIEISLYNDAKFYYNLPQLGDGTGKWEYNDGRIELFAERVLFDMYIEVLARDEEGDSVGIRFRDRHGPKSLDMSKYNIQ